MLSAPGVVIEPSAYHAMLIQSYFNPDREVRGILLGQVQQGYVHVLGHLPSEFTTEDQTSLGKGIDLCKRIINSRPREQLQLVGWYHTHLGKGCEPNNMDLSLQARFQQALSHFVGLILDTGGTSVNQPTHKIQLGAFNLSAQRQAVTLPVRIEHVMGAPTDTCHALATSSLAEFTRLSASGPIERLKKLSQQPTLSAMGLMLAECESWNSCVSGAIVENVGFVKQAFDLGLV